MRVQELLSVYAFTATALASPTLNLAARDGVEAEVAEASKSVSVTANPALCARDYRCNRLD